MTRLHLLFLLMCLIWGLTWIAMKVGVTAMPPVLFAALRFIAAGALLLGWSAMSGGWRHIPRRSWPRLLLASTFVITGCYAPLFWGMVHVASGLAAIVNLALVPTMLFLLGLAHGEERFSLRQAGAAALGIAGLALLFGPKIAADAHAELAGIVAIVLGTLSYCWGSILSRPLLRCYPPGLLSGQMTLIGGAELAVLSLAIESDAVESLPRLADPAVLASWLFLVLLGSLAGFTIYLRLLRDWGAARAGMYAFVSPVVAMLSGAVLFGERFGAVELAGIAVLLAATWLALHRPAPAATTRSASAGRGASSN